MAGYNTYGFNDNGDFPDLLQRLGKANTENCDLPGNEFWLGGEIVRNLNEDTKKRLEDAAVHIYANPEQLFDKLAEQFLSGAKNG